VTRSGRAHALIVVAALLAARATANCQSSEVWPELDILWQPAVHQRTFLELAGADDRDGPKREATAGLYQDYVFLPNGYVRGGYRFSFSTHDASYRESRLVAEAVLRLVSWRRLRLVERTRTEWRWVNGEPSYRVRERLHLQRVASQPRGLALAPYGTFEAYYDSRFRSIARLAGRIGSEARLGGPASIDIYLARQDNAREPPAYVNALGLVLKLSY
jgi:hypothetical protein